MTYNVFGGTLNPAQSNPKASVSVILGLRNECIVIGRISCRWDLTGSDKHVQCNVVKIAGCYCRFRSIPTFYSLLQLVLLSEEF